MYIKREKGQVSVTLPDGTRINRSDLPPRDTKRWVASRKAAVVRAVMGGLLSKEEACKHYTLSVEEFEGWQRAVEEFGESALKTTRIQKYRQL